MTIFCHKVQDHDEAQEAQVEAQVAIAAIAMSGTCLQRNFAYVE